MSAEHSGAYSSPQYAKKMFPKNYDSSAFLPKEKQETQFKSHQETNGYYNDTSSYARSSFLETAGSFLSGTGGQVVSDLAKDFIARSTGSSQVLSLNLTNLVILIVLKALVLAAGFFGAGAWKGHNYGRSLEDNKNVSYLTEDEIMLYLSYLSGQQSQDFGCLYRIACLKPHQSALYASGAELLLQGTKLFQGDSNELEPYEDISNGIREAASWGERGMPCHTRYQCT
ncbi:uncharacterized protein LOC112056663 isoform X2 [Bicyclus anynana]|uniref:Uncharacterized protein LOC112056663 isoform X2 n=1 Tax=Bicyclus anynana TaxID=110368 RepID=A0A6J1P533_BICAN|nr:uncharacterized protein LOC112056663 isoform X2 [Bicyclus anynana]